MAKLETDRLVLRQFRPDDADEFARLAGDWSVASMTSDIPYPFSSAQAGAWLEPARGELRFALECDGQLIGGAGYYRRPLGAAELGFWLGRPWWGRGYTTEATRAIVRFGFRRHRLPGFSSAHFVGNRASARVLEKLGFEPVGRGVIACAARGHDVEAVTYWLDCRRMPVANRDPKGRAGWRAWLGRRADEPA